MWMWSQGYLEMGTYKVNALKIISVTINCPSEQKAYLIIKSHGSQQQQKIDIHAYNMDTSHIIYISDVWKDWGVQLGDFGLSTWDISGASSSVL